MSQPLRETLCCCKILKHTVNRVSLCTHCRIIKHKGAGHGFCVCYHCSHVCACLFWVIDWDKLIPRIKLYCVHIGVYVCHVQAIVSTAPSTDSTITCWYYILSGSVLISNQLFINGMRSALSFCNIMYSSLGTLCVSVSLYYIRKPLQTYASLKYKLGILIDLCNATSSQLSARVHRAGKK